MAEINIRPHPGSPHRAPGRPSSNTGPTTGTARPCRPSVCSCELEAVAGPAGSILLLRVAGEVDLHSLPVLQHALTATIDQRPADLVVDLAAVGFCCVRGIALLVTAGTTAQTNRTTFTLSGLPPHLHRISTRLWPEEPFLHYRSAAAAVAALRIKQVYRPT